MAGRLAKIARGVGRALLVLVLSVIALVALVALAYVVLCNTAVGRGFARDLALEQANALFRGKLAARELSSLGVTGAGLSGVEVTDPTGARVIAAEALSVEISPWALLSGEVHVDRIVISNARVDLADLGTERGVLAAFALREPSPPEAEPAPESEPPVVLVTAIELDAIAVSTDVKDLGVVGVEDLSLRGSFALRGVPRAELTMLTTKLVRDHVEVGAIESAQAHWALEGEDSTLALRGRIARELAAALRQEVGFELNASGTLDALGKLDAQLALSSKAGDAKVIAKLLERDRLAVTVQSDGVTPGAIWLDAPSKRIAIDLAGNARIAKAPANMPFDLDLKSASLDGSPLPVLRAKGRVENDALCDLILNAQGQGVTVELSGDASPQKLNLHGTVRARDFKLAPASVATLDADITAVGPPTGPRASISLRGSGLRYEDFVVDQLAFDALGGPDIYTVSLNGRAPDGEVQLEGRVHLQERVVQLDAKARGALRERPFKLEVKQARVGYDGSIEIERAQLEGLGQRAVVHGRYGTSAKDELALDAQLDLKALSDALKLKTALQGKADVELHARGTLERPRAELSVHANDLGLHEPARKRPTIDATLEAQLDTLKGELTTSLEVDSGRDLDAKTQLTARFNARKAPWYDQLRAAHVEGSLALDALSTEWLEQWLLEPLPMRGRVLANATFAGTIDRPELALTTRAQLRPLERDASYEITLETRYAAGALDLKLNARDEHGEWITAAAALEHPAETIQRFIEPGAALADLAEWQATVQVAQRALGETPLDALTHKPLDPELAPIRVGVEVSASHAPHAEPAVSVTVSALKPPRGKTKVEIGLTEYACPDPQLELSVVAELANRNVEVRALLRNDAQTLLESTAKAKVVLEPTLSAGEAPKVSDANAMLQLNAIDLATLPRLCGLAQGQLSGRIDATSLLATDPKISVQLKGQRLSAGAPVGIDLDVRASVTPELATAELAFDHGKTRSTINGRVPIRWQGSAFEVVKDQPFQASVALNRFPVIALLPPSFAISRASGFLNGAVHADGTLAQPKVGGRIEPEDLALTVTGLAQPLHDIDGRISFSNRRLIVEHLVARDRDGKVTLNGSAELAENNDINAKLSIKADAFPLRQQGQISGELDAQIDVVARMTEHKTHVDIHLKDASAWLLGGELRKGIGLDEHPDIRDPRAKPIEKDETPPQDEVPPEPIEISINAEESFWVRREDFAVKLSTKLQLSIDDEKVSAIGPIKIHRGYLQLFGQTFDIDGKSKVDLDGGSPPDPVLDITASTTNRASSKKISVHIGGRSTAPELEFFIDGASATAGEAAVEIFGGRGGSGGSGAEGEAKSFVAGMMAGVMAMSARRELGDVVPILMIEPGGDMKTSRVRAGFELDKLVPGFLEGVIRGVYVEGIFAGSGEDDEASSGGVQGGVLIELYLPHDLVTAGQYGPGETWSVDLGWEP